ncbi:MAG: RagB/SusD family nutrient uptake outer membrane protein [Chitinophagaceae bacterium]|nr:RagB/SusD family nutrient uptake outer membrane protein [Chitinophagaceae bacterium]
MKTRMINTITLIAAISWLLVISVSCNKDYLERHPLDNISSETFWTNENDVNMALLGCYRRMDGSFLSFLRAYFEGLSDAGLAYWGFYGFEDNYKMGIISPESGGGKDDLYRTSYQGIAQCNFFLDNVDKATSVDPAIITRAKAEARFLRALFYFDLANCFGDVIIYQTTPENPDAAKIAKSPKADVLKFIHDDLDFAIANLPDEQYTKGHAVKGSALGLKTRVLITEQKWTETVATAQEIIDSGKFSIYNDYEGMFLNRGQENNPEIMFSCQYLSPDRYPSYYGYNIEYAKHIFLLKKLKDAFECTDGLPISESPLYNPANTFANRDPRHNYIIRNPQGTDWPGHYTYDFYDVTGVQNRKYIDPEIPGDYANNFRQDWDYILIRYADILLMYAEAKNEMSGPDQDVYKAINAVRQRTSVNMPPVDQARYNTQEKLREYIRHERFVEFPMEGIRYFDLKRWHIAHIEIPKQSNLSGVPYVFEEKHYLWPFSQFEMDANPNLVQTVGY